jgi:hypothetical protein
MADTLDEAKAAFRAAWGRRPSTVRPEPASVRFLRKKRTRNMIHAERSIFR